MKLTLPADAASAITEVGAVATLLDKNGWKAAAFIAVSIKPGAGQGARTSGTSARGRVSASQFAKDLNAKGWSRHIIERHYEGWEKAAAEGLVPVAADLTYGEKIDLPIEGWAEFYPPRWTGDEAAETVAAQARIDGVGPTTAITVSKNPKAMASAIKADPKIAAVAAQALVDAGAVETLSSATAAAAQNRRVERTRQRREEGLPRERTREEVQDQGFSPALGAFLSVKGLSEALRALVTTFPQEWAALSDAARDDEDFVGVCDETLDKLQIALDSIRMLIHGGVSDQALSDLLEREA